MWVWRGFEPRVRPVRPAPVKGLISDSIIPQAHIDSPLFQRVYARFLTSGVNGPESEEAYFPSVSMYSMPPRDLCVRGEQSVCWMSGGQVVCGGSVRVRVGVWALFCGAFIFAVDVTRPPRVKE